MKSGTTRTHVILPADLIKRVDARVGPRKRSQFIAEAVEAKLNRERLLEAFDRVAGSLKDVDTPGWNTPEETDAWVHALRTGDEETLRRLERR
jgi:hypothetical protein